MAGSITVTTSKVGNLSKYRIAWVSDGAGAVSGNSFAVGDGILEQVRYIPDGGGTQPTDLYDVVINDANSVDVLAGGGANLSNVNTTVAVPLISTYHRRVLEAGNLTPGITNAGASKGGTIDLLVRPV